MYRHLSCAGNEDGMFVLNPETGVLRTVALLDREEQDTYIFSIRAMDSAGANSLSSITEVCMYTTSHSINYYYPLLLQLTLILDDVNDNAPVFAEDEISINVNEREELGQVLLTLTATDRDLDRNSDIRYSLIGGEGTYVPKATVQIHYT